MKKALNITKKIGTLRDSLREIIPRDREGNPQPLRNPSRSRERLKGGKRPLEKDFIT